MVRWSYSILLDVLVKVRELVWDLHIIGVGKEYKLDLEVFFFFDNVEVSDCDVAIQRKLIIKLLSIKIPKHSKY